MLGLPRREWTSLLFGVAAACAAVGAAFVWLVPSDIDPLTRLQSYYQGRWWQAVEGVAWLGGAALVVTGVEIVSTAFRPRNRLEGKIRAGRSIEETIEDVRGQLTQAMEPRALDVSSGLDVLLAGAIALRASDVHLNPLVDGLQATYRVDGVLYPVMTVESEHSSRLTGRVKVLAKLDMYAREPQDGSLRRRIAETDLEARVSVLPSNHGERVVLRLVRGGQDVPLLSELGFDRETAKQLETCLAKPQGLLFVSGPVGSGKTTTLYSALQHLHRSRGETTAIMTLEDPIELQLPFATQTQINPKVGMSFAQTLRSVLRQDPGALMVGEIRDRETAEIAVQAGLTGHLILSTLHVQSAAGTFARLIEMDVEPFVLASSTVGSLAQRLVRGLCRSCRRQAEPTDDDRQRLAEIGLGIPNGDYFEAVGCGACQGRGYNRRIPIAELLLVSDAVMDAVRARQSTEEIRRIAIGEGMVPLGGQGLVLAAQGETSIAEVLRVAG